MVVFGVAGRVDLALQDTRNVNLFQNTPQTKKTQTLGETKNVEVHFLLQHCYVALQ